MEKEAVMCAVLVFVTASAGQDIQTTCPGFTEGVQSTIDCTVNITYYDSCFPAPVLVTFQYVNGGSPTQWCDTSYTACETTGHSQRDCNGCSCQCSHTNLTTKINKYSLTFVPNATYKGGSFYCEVTCSAPSSPQTKDHASCANAKVVNSTSTTPGDTESRSSSTLVIGLGVAGCACVVMAAVGFYCFRKRRPGGQNDAPPANAPPANAPRDNAAPDNAPPDNAPPDNAAPDTAAPDNAAPDNGPQGADTAGASTGQTVPTTPGAELDESSVAGTEASEASEGTEDSASQVSEV
ncbi:uncharacterized protein [Littorina saxatilis]|uniref:uncharacterized protein n=1 Tax=Littorina saxatilis TaxID=31220 RepID=UPI0038B53E8D